MDPPGSVQFMDVHPNDSRYGTVLQIIRNSFLDPHYQPSWVIHSLQTVKNLKLFQHYKTKSEELKLGGRDVTEYDMFTCYKTVDLIKNILEHGLQTRHSSFNFLGNSQKGVNLCRHADIQLKAADNTGQEECYLIIYKVMLGKALPVYPSPDNEQLAPTENFDSHISSLGVDRTIPLGQQAIRSQVFCYEYINGQLSTCPRHVLPYVVVCYKRPSHPGTRPPSISIPLQIQRPTIQPPPPPLVQMAPAPQPSAIPAMYQLHSSSDVSKMPTFQPRLPPRNPFRTQNFPLQPCPPQPYRADHRTQYTAGQGLPTVTACQAMPNLSLTSSGLIVPLNHQPTTGMRLPYISPPPPLLDAGNHLMFSHPSKSHFQARAPINSHAQPPNQQNFSMFHSSARPIALHTGMSIPLQLPASETTEGNIQPANSHKKELTGMRLPIIIQPEDPTPEETAPLSGQLCTEPQDIHMTLPAATAAGPSPPRKSITNGKNSTRPVSPVDIKPDIAKILLKTSKRKPTASENIIIDDEELCAIPEKNGVSDKEASTGNVPRQNSSASTDSTPGNSCQNAIQAADVVSGNQVSPLPSKPEKLSANDNRNHLPEVDSVSRSKQTAPTCSVSLVQNGDRKIGTNCNAKESTLGHNPGLNCHHEVVLNEEETSDGNHGHCKITKKLHLVEKPLPQVTPADEDETLPDLDDNDEDNVDSASSNRMRERNLSTGHADSVISLPSKLGKRKYHDIIRNLKRRRKENPFVRKRVNLFKFSDKNILNSLVQYPVTKEKSVYEFCHNGSIKMFCDAVYDSNNENDKENVNKRRGRLLFDKRLSRVDIDFLLNDIQAESVMFECEDLENALHKWQSCEGSHSKSVSSSPSTCKEMQQVAGSVNQEDAMLDIQTVRSDDDQTKTPEMHDVWGGIITDQRFQPKVVVKDIRSSSDWEAFVAKDKANTTKCEESVPLTLHISRVESVENCVGPVADLSKVDESQRSSFGGLSESNNGLTMEDQMPVAFREMDTSSDQLKENPTTPNLNQLQEENTICKTSVQNRTGNELCSDASVQNDSDKKKNSRPDEHRKTIHNQDVANTKSLCGSASATKSNCGSLMEQSEQSNSPSIVGDSLEIDSGHLESLASEQGVTQDLRKDGIAEESSSILNKGAGAKALPSGTNSAGTTNSTDRTEEVNDKQKASKKGNTSRGHDRAKIKQERRHAHSHRSYSDKYKHLSYKHRRSRHVKQFGSPYNRDMKGKYGSYREGKRCRPSERYQDKSHRVSVIKSGSDEDLFIKKRKRTEEYRSPCEEKGSFSESKGRRHSIHENSTSREAKKRRPNEPVRESSPSKSTRKQESKGEDSESQLLNKEEIATKDSEAKVSVEDEKREGILADARNTASEPTEQTEQLESVPNQRMSSKDDLTGLTVVDKPVESKLPSSTGLLKTCPEPDHVITEREAKSVNEKWVETCERLFLGRSGKEGSPLFDGYSASSGSSTAADPSEWLTKLIRINTKRTTTTTQEVSDKRDGMKDGETDSGISAIENSVSETELHTRDTSAEKTDALLSPNEAGLDNCKNEKSEASLSREELTSLVSRALTILKPGGAVSTTTDINHGEAQVEQTNTASSQNRLSAKYIHRKRKSLPAIGTQDGYEAGLPPKLWGAQSLEKMHQSVTCEEPAISSLPKYPISAPQTPVLISASSDSESLLSGSTDPDLRSANCRGSGCHGISVDTAAQTKDPRLRRLSLSPRTESGSDENLFQSPLSVDSPGRDSSVISSGDAENKISRPKTKISKLWEASISTPKALGNESVAFRELKVKERRTEAGQIRRHSSSDRAERRMSVDERFANYSPWKGELHLIDVPEFRGYQYLELQPESKDPRFNKKRTVHDSEVGKRATKHCRNIPLERIRKDKSIGSIKPTNDGLKGDGKYRRDEHKRSASTKTDLDDDRNKVALMGQNNPDVGQSLSGSDTGRQSTLARRTSVDHSDGKKSASRNPKFPTQSRIPITDIGACCPRVRATMEEVWQLGVDAYQSLDKEMTRQLNCRIKSIEDSQIFDDPTKGLDQHKRLKLIASTDVNDDVIQELQIEEEMRAIKEKNHKMRQKLDDALKNKSLADSAIKELKSQIDIRDIKYEKYSKQLEDLGRFYKSSVVEVLPDMFRLDSEKNKFISAEGNMLFLMSPLKEADCKRLLALVEEIKEYMTMMDNSGATDEHEQRARLCLGWLHGERKDILCQLCLNMYRMKQVLLQRFLDKRTWCSKAESVLESRHEKVDLVNYINSRYHMLEMYISVLRNVQRLDNGVWTVKTSKYCGEPEAQTDISCDNEGTPDSRNIHACERRSTNGISDSKMDKGKKGQETVRTTSLSSIKGSDEDESKTPFQAEKNAVPEANVVQCNPDQNLKGFNITDDPLKKHDEKVPTERSQVTGQKDLNSAVSEREKHRTVVGQLQPESKSVSNSNIDEHDAMDWHQLDEGNINLGSGGAGQENVVVLTDTAKAVAKQYERTAKDKPMVTSQIVSEQLSHSSFHNSYDSLLNQSRTSVGCSPEMCVDKLQEGLKQSVVGSRPEDDGKAVQHDDAAADDDNGCDAFASYGKFEQMCNSAGIQPTATDVGDKPTQEASRKHGRKRRKRQKKKQKGRGIGVVCSKVKRFRKSAIPPEPAADTIQYSSGNHFNNGAGAFPLNITEEPVGHLLTETGQYAFGDSNNPRMIDRCERGSFGGNCYQNDRFVPRSWRPRRSWYARKSRQMGRLSDTSGYPQQHAQRPFHRSPRHKFGNRARSTAYCDRSNLPSRFQ